MNIGQSVKFRSVSDREYPTLRPIVSFCPSLTYELSKYLVSIHKPHTENSKHHLINSEAFITKIKDAQISEDQGRSQGGAEGAAAPPFC